MGVCSVLGISYIQMLIYKLAASVSHTHTCASPCIRTGSWLDYFFFLEPQRALIVSDGRLWGRRPRLPLLLPNMNAAIMKIGSRTGRKSEHPTNQQRICISMGRSKIASSRFFFFPWSLLSAARHLPAASMKGKFKMVKLQIFTTTDKNPASQHPLLASSRTEKPKDFSFTAIHEKEKQQMFDFFDWNVTFHLIIQLMVAALVPLKGSVYYQLTTREDWKHTEQR